MRSAIVSSLRSSVGRSQMARTPSAGSLTGQTSTFGQTGSKTLPESIARVLPGELWGAYNVLTSVSRSFITKPPLTTTKASSVAAADFSYVEDDSAFGSAEEQQQLRDRLDFRPRLSLIDIALCALIPAGICAALYFGVRPRRVTLLYGLGLSLIYAAWVAICRALLLERHYTERLLDGRQLADRDSRFTDLDGVSVHYKAHRPAGTPVAAIHCYHGFGANTGSWDPVQQKMARKLEASVTSHDMPGFGLTSRPKDLDKYTPAFNGRLGRQLMTAELAQSNSQTLDSAGSHEVYPQVLMGHSMGAACATAEILNNPKEVKGLILVAPAVIAFGFAMPKSAGKVGAASKDEESVKVTFGPSLPPGTIKKRPRQRNLFSRLAIALTQAFLKLTSGVWRRLLEPVTVISLRSAVRTRAFWERGLRRAWHDKSGVKPHVVDAYRRPQLVRGWEKGLINFTAARVAGGRGVVETVKDAWNGRVKPTQAEELADLIAERNLKVLIIHGDKDALVPLRNSVRLAALLPNTQLRVMKDAGHVPHEERPDEFLGLVEKFMSTM